MSQIEIAKTLSKGRGYSEKNNNISINKNDLISPFSIPTDTANQLINICKKKNINIDEPIYLYENYRQKKEDLKYLESKRKELER